MNPLGYATRAIGEVSFLLLTTVPTDWPGRAGTPAKLLGSGSAMGTGGR